MKVALCSAFQPVKAPGTVRPGAALLDPAGARVVLGCAASALAEPILPSAVRLFGPRGLCFAAGGLWVTDTGHHRLLGWRRVPGEDDTPADIVLGQPDFGAEGRNARGLPNAATLNVPTGVTSLGTGLAVADAWNHRVLIWRRPPEGPGDQADIVLGQQDGSGVLANRGADRPRADSLHWPYGIAAIGDRLLVCDTGNRRVLVWTDPRETGQPADLVLGQTSFDCRDENAGAGVSAGSMRWPHAAVGWHGGLAIADAGNNRIMLWQDFPETSGQPADAVMGQCDFAGCDHNLGRYYPSDGSLNMPYAATVARGRLIVGDTANSRLIGFDTPGMATPARWLTGQPDFSAKGDNRWGLATRDSLCWPYGLASDGRTIGIADSGNNRVLLWDLAP